MLILSGLPMDLSFMDLAVSAVGRKRPLHVFRIINKQNPVDINRWNVDGMYKLYRSVSQAGNIELARMISHHYLEFIHVLMHRMHRSKLIPIVAFLNRECVIGCCVWVGSGVSVQYGGQITITTNNFELPHESAALCIVEISESMCAVIRLVPSSTLIKTDSMIRFQDHKVPMSGLMCTSPCAVASVFNMRRLLEVRHQMSSAQDTSSTTATELWVENIDDSNDLKTTLIICCTKLAVTMNIAVNATVAFHEKTKIGVDGFRADLDTTRHLVNVILAMLTAPLSEVSYMYFQFSRFFPQKLRFDIHHTIRPIHHDLLCMAQGRKLDHTREHQIIASYCRAVLPRELVNWTRYPDMLRLISSDSRN